MTLHLPYFSPECFEWCKEQNFIHASNLQVQTMFLLLLAFAVFLGAYFINTYSEHIKSSYGISEEKLTKIFTLLYEFGLYLLAGFFIWYVWFR